MLANIKRNLKAEKTILYFTKLYSYGIGLSNRIITPGKPVGCVY